MTRNDKIRKELEGKRLLILGGGVFKDALKMVADTYGIEIVAAGNDKHSDMFSIAQEKYYVDSTDAELMKRLIINQKIDGVFMGGNEPVISEACIYLQDLGLPCYCTKDQWDILQNKKYFKKLCQKHDLPVAISYDIKEEDIGGFSNFPVITKPTNSCGSKGFSICFNETELREGYINAKRTSPTEDVIVEQLVKNESVCACYTVCNGKLYFSGLEDKYPVQFNKQSSFIGGFYVFESKLTEDFRNKYESKIADLVSDVGIKQGNFWIEVFKDGENYYFNEAGFRYGGSVTIYPIDYMHGINQVATDVYYALTGKGIINGFSPLVPEKFHKDGRKNYAIYSVVAHAGTICDIKGIEEVEEIDNVVYVIIKRHVGELVQETGTLSQVVALVHFLFETEEELKKIVMYIRTKLYFIDQYGKNMDYDILDLENFHLR